jgi:chemotaxis protein histidine kinase CheA
MSIRERAKRLRGEVEIAAQDGNGSKITLRIPLERKIPSEQMVTGWPPSDKPSGSIHA